MSTDDVARWLSRYVEVWRSGDLSRVAELFTEAAAYHTDPFRPPRRGLGEIAAYWEESGDAPDAFVAEYAPLLVAGDAAVAHGFSRYLELPGAAAPREYRNLFFLRFAPDGRCAEYREWYMLDPSEAAGAAPA